MKNEFHVFMPLGLILERFPVMAQQADVCLQLSETKFAGPKKSDVKKNLPSNRNIQLTNHMVTSSI